MNTASKYIISQINAVENNNKAAGKKIILQKNIDSNEKPDNLIISYPTQHKIMYDSIKQHIKDVNYPINNILNTNYALLEKTKNINIFVCIYRLKTVESINPLHYIEYLLYKYSENSKKIPIELRNSLIFPFEISNGKETYLNIADKLFNTITGGIYGKIKTQGFLENGNDIFFFYQAIENKHIEIIQYRNSENQIWWALIDEICNHKKLINFPIRERVYSLFYNNATLIYLRNINNKHIEIPVVGYIGAYYKFVPTIALQISFSSKINNERMFGSFLYAVRKGGWTDNFKPQSIDGVEIADKNGKYTKGGIIRFAVFLNTTDVVGVTNRDLEKYIKNPEDWKKNFQSLFYGKLNGKIHSNNSHFEISTFAQQTPLTFHYLDMKTLEKWDPKSNAYNID